MKISLEKLVWKLLGLSILATLVNGLSGPIPINELGLELWTYVAAVFMAAVWWMVLRRGKAHAPITKNFFRIQAFFLILLVVSLALNFGDILSGYTNGTSAVLKFLAASIVYGYSLLFALSISVLIDREGIEGGLDKLARVFVVLAWVAIVVGAFEIATWFAPELRRAFISFRGIYSIRPAGEFLRLNGLSYEPSFFSAVQLCAFPWVVYDLQRRRLARNYLLIVLLLGLSYVSGSRTHLIGSGVLLTSIFIMGAGRWGRRTQQVATTGLVLSFFVLGPALPAIILNQLSVGSSVSDITRATLAGEAIEAGFNNPLGLGFGQSNAAAVAGLDGGGFPSWELDSYFNGENGDDLPPVYSWFARAIAEFGIIGYGAIAISACFGIVRCVGKAARQKATRPLVLLLILNVAAFFAIGVSTETYRFFALWGAMIVAACIKTISRSEISAPIVAGKKRRRIVLRRPSLGQSS
ncbi:hypothetical protein [Pseudophaeobacter arcticus]|uniref:hypothetical protein n=1 Tax=Pseudophaeobacter arcticus TaxID=385492 RepID=UPI00333E50F6